MLARRSANCARIWNIAANAVAGRGERPVPAIDVRAGAPAGAYCAPLSDFSSNVDTYSAFWWS